MDERTLREHRAQTFRRRARIQLVFVLLAAAFCAITVLNVNIGSVPIPVTEIAKIIFTKSGDPTQVNIIWKIRLPRILMAAVLGGALSVSGFLLQTFFSNPIAGPFVLGISSGAKMTVALTMIFFLEKLGSVSGLALILAAFAGSLLSVGFILILSRRLRHMAVLLVAGIMIGYICSAVTDFVITFARESDIVNLHGWSQGSFSGMTWQNVGAASAMVAVGVLAVFGMAKPIGAYQLGEGYARSMGVNIKVFRTALIVLSSLLSACVTAFAGPISFVGIAVPHLMKTLFHSAEPLIMLPACFLGGGVFCLFCDLIARTAFAPTEVSISSVTAIFGAPIVIYMMIHRKAV